MSENKWKKRLYHYLNKNYASAKALFFYELKKYSQNKSKTPIIVYTNGKVGSSTLHASLENDGQIPVFHVHHLNQKYLDNYENYVKQHYFRKPNRGQHLWRSLLWRPQFVRKYFLGQKNLKFIIIWRDPIAKNISTFFQWIHFTENENTFRFSSHQYDMQFDIETPKNDLSILIEHFLKHFPHKTHENWLQIEQQEVLNLPFKNYPFDLEKNYQIIENGKNKVLIIKLEAFKQPDYPKIIGDFCEVEHFEFQNANLTQEKEKYKPYQLFLEQIKIPQHLLNDLYESEFTKHYYTASEIENFRKKWEK